MRDSIPFLITGSIGTRVFETPLLFRTRISTVKVSVDLMEVCLHKNPRRLSSST